MYDVIIVGGGISGLYSAVQLSQLGKQVKVLEAGSRLGGRIFSQPSAFIKEGGADIGPSWFWPGQPSIEKLIRELDLEFNIFEQFSDGDSLYEPISGSVQQGIAGISMAGSYRVAGGLSVVIDALQQRLDSKQVELNARVSVVEATQIGCKVNYSGGRSISGKKVIMALPPRVAANTITFSPQLPQSRLIELNNIATWMAGHAKAVILFQSAFWKEKGLSGDVFSQKGPLSEIHDASPYNSDISALFGFFSLEPSERVLNTQELEASIKDQLVRIFGQAASNPLQILFKDWAKDDLVATEFDQQIATHHQMNIPFNIKEPDWEKRLTWSGTEMAKGRFNGYIEGAINASEAALAALDSS